MTIEEMRSQGVNAETIVWKAGMADWAKAATLPELMRVLQPAPAQQPYQQPMQQPYQQQPMQQPYQQQPYQQAGYNQSQKAEYPQPENNPYQQQPYQRAGYNQPYQQQPYEQPGFGGYEAPHTNWLPWAIVGTVLGLCGLGMIFGIIAIVKATNANKLYAQGNNTEAETVNNSAKTFTIVSFCCAALGIILGFIMGIAGAL